MFGWFIGVGSSTNQSMVDNDIEANDDPLMTMVDINKTENIINILITIFFVYY